jgi:hypothetical protein
MSGDMSRPGARLVLVTGGAGEAAAADLERLS